MLFVMGSKPLFLMKTITRGKLILKETKMPTSITNTVCLVRFLSFGFYIEELSDHSLGPRELHQSSSRPKKKEEKVNKLAKYWNMLMEENRRGSCIQHRRVEKPCFSWNLHLSLLIFYFMQLLKYCFWVSLTATQDFLSSFNGQNSELGKHLLPHPPPPFLPSFQNRGTRTSSSGALLLNFRAPPRQWN